MVDSGSGSGQRGVEPTVPSVAGDVVTARRVAVRLGLMDLDGRVVARGDRPGRALMTPGPSVIPRRLDVAGLLSLDLEQDPPQVEGVVGLGLDMAILRRRADVGAIAVASPRTAMALGSVGRDILPLTHTGAAAVIDGAAWIDAATYVRMPDDADAVARAVGRSAIIHVPGVALFALGDSPLDALRRLDVIDSLARMTVVATGLTADPVTVTREQSDAIPRQRPVEVRPSRDYRRYYRSLDGPDARGRALHWPADDGIAAVKRDIALACRILARHGDLVAFFEHVSHRLPGLDDRFAMSPAKDFAAMEPSDIGVIEMDGRCEQVEGDIPAAPFRWYHRDVFQARPDVKAIVHTHELHGRAWVLAGASCPPLSRMAVHGMRDAMPPVFPTPSLLFGQEDRDAMIQRLADGPWVHALAHGTDFCATDIATATVRAVHREAHLRDSTLARSLGTPRVLGADVLDVLEREGPSIADWWSAYVDEEVG